MKSVTKVFAIVAAFSLLAYACTKEDTPSGPNTPNTPNDPEPPASTIVQGTIGEGTFVNWNNQSSTLYGLDFDNDGVLEVSIKDGYDYEGNQCGKSSLEYAYDKVKIAVPSTDYWDILRLLNEGDPIGSSTTFAGEGDAMFNDYTAVSTTASYVGFKLINGSTVKYAYAKIHRSGNAIVWDAIYCNTTSGESITAGATSKMGNDGVCDSTGCGHHGNCTGTCDSTGCGGHHGNGGCQGGGHGHHGQN